MEANGGAGDFFFHEVEEVAAEVVGFYVAPSGEVVAHTEAEAVEGVAVVAESARGGVFFDGEELEESGFELVVLRSGWLGGRGGHLIVRMP